jgi:hypothetical protein
VHDVLGLALFGRALIASTRRVRGCGTSSAVHRCSEFLGRNKFHRGQHLSVVAARRCDGAVASSLSSSFQMLACSVSPGTPRWRTGRRRNEPGSRRRRGTCRRSLCTRCRRCTGHAGSGAEKQPPQRIPNRSAADCGRRTTGTAAPAAAGSVAPPRHRVRGPAAPPPSTDPAHRRSRPRRGREDRPFGGPQQRAVGVSPLFR